MVVRTSAVACDVPGVGKWEKRRVLDDEIIWRFNKCREALPPDVGEWLAVRSCAHTLNGDLLDDRHSNTHTGVFDVQA